MDNNLIKKQKELDAYWKDRLSNERLKDMIDVERRWSEWLSIKRDALMEYGFSREETTQIICAIISKLEFHQKIRAINPEPDNE